MEHATDFYDKAKKRIYVGDVLEHRLGKFGKSGGRGPSRYVVIRSGKKVRLEAPSSSGRKVTIDLTEQFAERAVIVDRKIFR